MNTHSVGANQNRVLVIGSGAAGLAAIKECLAAGLKPICYEQDCTIGGLWSYSPTCSNETHSSLYDSTVVHTSKEVMSFSDFPIPDSWPTFLHRSKVAEYLHLYSKHFNLEAFIKFNRRVVSVEPIMDENEHTGKWMVISEKVKKKGKRAPLFTASRSNNTSETKDSQYICSRNEENDPEPFSPPPSPQVGIQNSRSLDHSTKTGISFDTVRSDPTSKLSNSKQEIFDFVMVCTGHHWAPRMPDFPGIERFKGKVIHSHAYRVPYPFKDENVLIIGVGNSGMDIASEISQHSRLSKF